MKKSYLIFICILGVLLQISGCKKEEKNLGPYCRITQPKDRYEANSGDTVAIYVEASDREKDGKILKVIFSIDGIERIVDNTPPYTYTWTTSNEENDKHSVIATCIDNGGASAFNEITIFIIDYRPCPGIPTLHYEGQDYNTVQIGDQCWLKENLNVGKMILWDQEMSNNGIIEKYCYDDKLYNCNKYGGLYRWSEMMSYTSEQGGQGICPPGWHVPTDEEWKALEGKVDSQYGLGDPEWDNLYWRGKDAGEKLKTTWGYGWEVNKNGTDAFGYSALPAGLHAFVFGSYRELNESAYFWTSSFDYYRGLSGNSVYRQNYSSTNYSYSVRCIKD